MFLTRCASSLRAARVETLSSSSFRSIHTQSIQDTLKGLLRHSAQPVVVVTSLLNHEGSPHPQYHGATLSSFTSVAMDPFPLVAFSLRTPSRMASSIHTHAPSSSQSTPHIVINLLSSAQADIALRFSRPDLYPQPFSETEWHPNKEGIPIVTGSLGSISCSVVASTRLDTFGSGDQGATSNSAEDAQGAGHPIVSELFLARVLRIEKPGEGPSSDNGLLPLVYHDRMYTTVKA